MSFVSLYAKMKILLLLATVLSLSLAKEIFDFNVENIKFELDKTLVEDFLDKYAEGDDDAVVAIVNEYADKVFKNIEVYAVEQHLDPLNLTDVDEEFLTASITLTDGKLNGISTIERFDDVTISYQPNEKILDLYVPIIFSKLNFTYDYHVIVLLIGPKGSLVGEVKDFQMNVRLQFDFNTYHAAIVDVSTSNKGHVSLTIHGNAIVDVVVNILSEFATTILQPLIGAKIEDMVTDVVELIVETVNNAIDNILYPDSSTSSSFIEKENRNFYNFS